MIFSVFREDKLPIFDVMWIRFVCKGKEIYLSVLNKLNMRSTRKQTKFVLKKQKCYDVYA